MKRYGLLALIIASFLVTLVVGFKPWTAEGSSFKCKKKGRNELVCSSMHHLRRQIFMLQAQRDLMQIDYQWLAAISDEMYELLDALIVNAGDDLGRKVDESHPPLPVAVLEQLKGKTRILATHARRGEFAALGVANQLQRQCFACHSKRNPQSDYDWKKVFEFGWSYVVKHCNDPTGPETRIPYRCKNMHGMLSVLDYLESSTALESTYGKYNDKGEIADENMWEPNYSTITAATSELSRIAENLGKNKAIPGESEHGGQLHKVIELAEAMKAYSTQLENNPGDSSAKSELRALMRNGTKACMECHGTSRKMPGGN